MASLTRTATDVATDALSRIGVTQAGQDISSEDMDLALGRFDEVLADLSARNVVYVPDTDAIDLAFFTHLSAILGVTLLGDFPLDDSPALPSNDISEAKLRQMNLNVGRSRPVRVSYF